MGVPWPMVAAIRLRSCWSHPDGMGGGVSPMPVAIEHRASPNSGRKPWRRNHLPSSRSAVTGSLMRSTFTISACSRRRSIRSTPAMPLGKPRSSCRRGPADGEGDQMTTQEQGQPRGDTVVGGVATLSPRGIFSLANPSRQAELYAGASPLRGVAAAVALTTTPTARGGRHQSFVVNPRLTRRSSARCMGNSRVLGNSGSTKRIVTKRSRMVYPNFAIQTTLRSTLLS